MKLYGGIDLHSTNVVTQLINEEDKVLYRKKQGCDLDQILHGLEPFKEGIEGIAVESTYNWYWLVDGLMEAGYKVHLVNTAAVWISLAPGNLKHSHDAASPGHRTTPHTTSPSVQL